MKEIKKVVGYIRVSTDMQVDGYSLEAQENEIRNKCKKEEWELLHVFKDEGISGKTIVEREGIKSLLHLIKNNDIDAVIVFKLSRLGRNSRDLLNIYHYMEENGCELIAIKDNIDTRNSNSKLMLNLMSGLSEFERKNILEQTVSGMMQKARKGGYQGGRPPLGYKLVDKELKVDEEQRKCVESIFKMYLNGFGYEAIASALNNEGYKTSIGEKFKKSTVKYILENPIYIGTIRWGTNKLRRHKDKEYYIEVSNAHDPIIPEEVFQLVQEMRASNPRRHVKRFNNHHILSGILRCPYCGDYGMSIQRVKDSKSGKYYLYYTCNQYANKKRCTAKGIRKEIIEAEFYAIFEAILNKPEILKVLISKKGKESVEGMLGTKQKEKSSLEKKKASLEKKLDNALTLSIDTEISELRINYQNKAMDFKKQIQEIEEKINEMNKSIEEEPKIQKIDVTKLQLLLKKVGSILPCLDNESQQNLVRKLVEKIEVKDSHISKITFKFEKGLNININEDEIHSIRENFRINECKVNRTINRGKKSCK